MGYVYVLVTIALVVLGQLLIKWRIAAYGALPEGFAERLAFLLKLVIDPYIFCGLAAAFVAALAWMAALTQLELGKAYPLMSLSFAVVLALSSWLLGEPLTAHRVAGVALIILGAAVVGYGR